MLLSTPLGSCFRSRFEIRAASPLVPVESSAQLVLLCARAVGTSTVYSLPWDGESVTTGAFWGKWDSCLFSRPLRELVARRAAGLVAPCSTHARDPHLGGAFPIMNRAAKAVTVIVNFAMVERWAFQPVVGTSKPKEAND